MYIHYVQWRVVCSPNLVLPGCLEDFTQPPKPTSNLTVLAYLFTGFTQPLNYLPRPFAPLPLGVTFVAVADLVAFLVLLVGVAPSILAISSRLLLETSGSHHLFAWMGSQKICWIFPAVFFPVSNFWVVPFPVVPSCRFITLLLHCNLSLRRPLRDPLGDVSVRDGWSLPWRMVLLYLVSFLPGLLSWGMCICLGLHLTIVDREWLQLWSSL